MRAERERERAEAERAPRGAADERLCFLCVWPRELRIARGATAAHELRLNSPTPSANASNRVVLCMQTSGCLVVCGRASLSAWRPGGAADAALAVL